MVFFLLQQIFSHFLSGKFIKYLKFIESGSRDNPCPTLGNIVTIKLSEGEEAVCQPGGSYITMLAETHFQMNYNTGEWRRIKKYKALPLPQVAT